MKTLLEKPRRFVDTETTGLDPDVHEIIEIAIIDEHGNEILHTKVKPQHIETAHPVALRVNGYNEEDWKNAPTWEEIAPAVSEALQGALIFGQNIRFDYEFITRHMKKVDSKLLKGLGYHTIDTITLAWEHLGPCGVKSVSLDRICTFLGISNEGAHTALVDARRCLEVYHLLLRASPLQRLWWRLTSKSRLAKVERM